MKMKVGLIAGAFDVIHPGYIQALAEAKMYCTYLCVCIHADPSLENPKKFPPVLSVEARAFILQAIRYVDMTRIYHNEQEFMRLLIEVNPDIRFLGEDYAIELKKVTGSELNIPIHYLDRAHGWSATKFKRLIAQSLGNNGREKDKRPEPLNSPETILKGW